MKWKAVLSILIVSFIVAACQQTNITSRDAEAQLPSPTETATQVMTEPPAPTEIPPTATPIPTINPETVLTLQKDSDLPMIRFYPGYGFTESENSRIGDTFPFDPWEQPCPEFENDWVGGHIKQLGFKWVRVSIDYIELDPAREAGNFSKFEINPCHDEAITFLYENDITIMHTIVYWDETLHADRYPSYKNEEEVQQFLDYTRMIVAAFKGRVQYYEILNEGYFYVEVEDYIELIRQVIPVIREEDPAAKIVVGGTTDLMNPGMQWYIGQVIQSDIISQVDGINLHPMYGPSPQYAETRQYYQDYPEIIRGIQNTAGENGFAGEIFAEEMNWRTAINPHPYEIWQYSETQAAKYYARGIVINLGLDLWAGIGGERYETIAPVVKVVQSLSNLMVGAQPDDLNVVIESESEEIVYYSFSYPNGDRIVAIWRDGVALDDDPGVAATLSIDGLSAESAVGYDILYPFYQEIAFEMDVNGLVIRDLVVRDYPTLIRFTNSE